MQALVSVEGLEREVKVGRQNRGFENECCSRENYSSSLSPAAELRYELIDWNFHIMKDGLLSTVKPVSQLLSQP